MSDEILEKLVKAPSTRRHPPRLAPEDRDVRRLVESGHPADAAQLLVDNLVDEVPSSPGGCPQRAAAPGQPK